MSQGDPSIEDLKDVIRLCPAIDNHAHNLLLPSHEDSYSFLSATTEATGDALHDTPRSLPHLRMVRQLRELYGCDKSAGWEDLMIKRHELLAADHHHLLRKCFEGIHTILMDDGLDSETVQSYEWHDQFIQSRTFRIVRIETVAADILRGMHESGRLHIDQAIDDEDYCAEVWITFLGAFETAIANFIRDDEVVGFKSVICYRTGLDVIVAPDVEVATEGLDAFRDDYIPGCVDDDFRVQSKGLNDCLLISTCRLLTAGLEQTGFAKPLQFHTGLGDNDISLLRSNPAHLQPLIEKFPEVQFILLHSSYPYTRQAGYLATVFKNVFLDLGEVFPMVSRDGQEVIIRQAMELTPMSKLLYSTDAHHWAEVYWLADKQFRQAFEKVLIDYVKNEDLTVQQAMDAARDIYFYNSSKVYNLDLDLPQLKKKPLQLGWKGSSAPTDTQSSTTTKAASTPGPYNESILQSFLQNHNDLQFIYVQWLDYMATLRVRVFPRQAFLDLIKQGNLISIAKGNLGTLQNDTVTSAVNPQGQILVEPDLSTLRRNQSKDPLRSASVIALFRDTDGGSSITCPRGNLQHSVASIEDQHNINLIIGFEIELVLLHRVDKDNYAPTDTNHAWASMTPEQSTTTMPILAEIVTELASMGITVLQFHSESGPGQYEIVLPPLPAIIAVDTLVQARQAVQQIAHSHGLRATLHPVPLGGTGSGQHAHISLNSSTISEQALERKEMSFFASVLEHLPSICAFSLSNEVSYQRVKDDSWTGGTWCCWGTQNREVPLRRVKNGRWEVRCMDGFANPYLALHAILLAGLIGMDDKREMRVKDCHENPARLSEEQREEMGIVRKMPLNLDEALVALEGDHELASRLRSGLANDFITMKRAEKEMLDEMSELDRRVWLIERY